MRKTAIIACCETARTKRADRSHPIVGEITLIDRSTDLRRKTPERSLARNRAVFIQRLWSLVPAGDTLYDYVCREARFRHPPGAWRRSDWFDEIHSIGLTETQEALQRWTEAYDDRWIDFAKQSIHRAIERAFYHERKIRIAADRDWYLIEDRSANFAEIIAIEDQRESVRMMIDRLPTEDQFIVRAWFFENQSQAAIGRAIGKSQAYVSGRIQHVLASLREWIKGGGGIRIIAPIRNNRLCSFCSINRRCCGGDYRNQLQSKPTPELRAK